MDIPFIKPMKSLNELTFIKDSLEIGRTWGGGKYTKDCSEWLEKELGVRKALITTSATDALEMMALLLEIKPGDEVIMPSYTFVSSANAFAMRGATPVFVDIERRTLNIDVDLIENAISEKTKAILIMNYAGFSCNIDKVKLLAQKHKIYLIEDAAQSLLAKYNDRNLGSFGDLACISFHGSKNISSGEGGALLINNQKFIERAEVILEKGTNRKKFINGEVDKYTWLEIGSSFLASELTASYLSAQLIESHEITRKRILNWNIYHDFFTRCAEEYDLHLIEPQSYSAHNGHLYYIILKDTNTQINFLSEMKMLSTNCASHYVPLHSSKAGRALGRVGSDMTNTDSLWNRLVRLPLWSENHLPIELVLRNAKITLQKISE
jgi:dTDP-4-amino-4,6-dideoxygalactose transaminase